MLDLWKLKLWWNKMEVLVSVVIREWPNSCVPVIATIRNIAKKEKLEAAAGTALNRTLEIKQLDVRDEKSICSCINSIPNRQIDILSKYPKCLVHSSSPGVGSAGKLSEECAGGGRPTSRNPSNGGDPWKRNILGWLQWDSCNGGGIGCLSSSIVDLFVHIYAAWSSLASFS